MPKDTHFLEKIIRGLCQPTTTRTHTIQIFRQDRVGVLRRSEAAQ